MKSFNTGWFRIGTALIVGCASLAACGDDDGGTGTGGGTTTATSSTTSGVTTTATSSGSNTTTTGGTGGGDTDAFAFATETVDDYTQIDRHGAPEAGTAGIEGEKGLGLNDEDLSLRDEYNADMPVDDAAGTWVPEISESVTIFHQVLDDDLIALDLVPATVEESLAQAGPVIVPDTIKYDPAQPTSYPNGRNLEDQVVDITLAAVLLQLGPNQPLTLFADLPLNPPENDVAFMAEFPYLADPH